jgi:hypothetical protein
MIKEYNITLTGGFKEAKKRPIKKKKSSDLTWYYLGLVGQIGYVVALPIAGGAIIGSLVGITLIGLIVGFVISAFGFVRVVQQIIRKKE